MIRSLGILSITVGVVYFILLALAILMHREPWTPMLTLLLVGVAIAAFIFWIRALADCLLNEPNDGWGKLVWTLAIVFTFVIGAAIYYVGQRPRRLARTDK
jgi:peptidoglycan/LPS O-acetylase OafA/YrhL